jgi:hypothetical protein
MADSFLEFEHRGWEDPAVCAQYDDYLRGSRPSQLSLCSMRYGLAEVIAH